MEERTGPKQAGGDDTNGEIRSRISRRMVQLHKEYYGKGPTKAKTYYFDDTVLVLLRGGYTKVEETLMRDGRGAAVIEQRMEFQNAMRERFNGVIEEATGRPVIAFMSGNHQEPDLLAEVFVLGPTDLLEGGESEAD